MCRFVRKAMLCVLARLPLHNSPDRADPAILKYFTMGFLL